MAPLIYAAEYRAMPEAVSQFSMRHGNNDGHDNGIFNGYSDVPLNAEGRAQVTASGQFLKSRGIKLIIASDIARVSQSADIVGQIVGATVELDKELRERNPGALGGRPYAEIRDQLDWYHQHPDEQIPNGESLRQAHGRLMSAIARLRIRNKTEGPILLVGHHPLIKICKGPETKGIPIVLASVWEFNDEGFVEFLFAPEGATK